MFVSVVKTSFRLFARGMDASNLDLVRRTRMGDIRGVLRFIQLFERVGVVFAHYNLFPFSNCSLLPPRPP